MTVVFYPFPAKKRGFEKILSFAGGKRGKDTFCNALFSRNSLKFSCKSDRLYHVV